MAADSAPIRTSIDIARYRALNGMGVCGRVETTLVM
jgi:hypothetical protein